MVSEPLHSFAGPSRRIAHTGSLADALRDLWRWLRGVKPTSVERRHEDFAVDRIRAALEDEDDEA